MNFSLRLKELREQRNLTQAELARALGVGIATVGMWESSKRKPPAEKLLKIAKFFNTTIGYLLGEVDNPSDFDFDIYSLDGIEPLPEFELIPLIGSIACGTPMYAEENIEEYLKADRRFRANFALRCKGDSMINARIFNGDIVYIHQQDDVDNGEIAAVLIDDETTLKRVYKYPNRLELRPENPVYPVLNYENEQLNEIRILGKAVAFTSIIR